MSLTIWIGILLCFTQSAMFSGLNLAIFSVSRLRLEVMAANGNADAIRLLGLRHDSNLTLTTILWGNVAVNVLLTLLSGSVLTGMGAFLFSTVGITLFGEIIPPAYFPRKAVRIAARLMPVLSVYRWVLFPVAKPTAIMLDWWLGPEGISLFRERDFRALITRHIDVAHTEIGRLEAVGALNFLDLDDIMAGQEGEQVDPRSIIHLPVREHKPVLPRFERAASDPFLQQVNASGKKWVIFTDDIGAPRLVMDAHRFLRGALFGGASFNPEAYWHRPIFVTNSQTRLSELIGLLKVHPQSPEDDVIDNDLILAWGQQKRIITGADLLGRLLRGIAGRDTKT
jgi:metal transporter CNNM